MYVIYVNIIHESQSLGNSALSVIYRRIQRSTANTIFGNQLHSSTSSFTMVHTKEKVCLICIDGTFHTRQFVWRQLNNGIGWGICPPDGNPKGDAIGNAKTPVMDIFEKEGPFCELEAHGLAVGLPEGLMGNSEGPSSTLDRPKLTI
jgi:hypothetical protein